MNSENCGLSKSRVFTIINESGAHPYRSTPVQGLLRRDAERRYTWCKFVTNSLEDHPTFLTDIIWADEACVSRTGMFNRQNIHTWLIGPVFYERTLTVQRCLELLQDVINEFVETLPLHQLRNVWFQHDGVPPHKISNVKQYLMETFQNQVIGYGGFVDCSPRLPDLTTLDFLWGHINGQVFATPLPTMQDL
ncbi:hypothetical protein AVEN_56804-1 [Araneus ventricosus]|uniref:Tc1-like transposase DDE domain-containing protein n=1 Tax=Araneus ventricosus TaxID=182803 RepID=A0A4Y2K904_ARAVE|nr:hypothetical protein AVEN_56804-1 [Araneus ventricosus]